MVADINPAYLAFSQTRRSEYASSGLLMSVWGGGAFTLMYLPLFIRSVMSVERIGILSVIVDAVLLAAGFAFAFGVPLRMLRRPRSPILLSRRLRRFYHWQNKKKGWVALSYDDVVPYVMRVTSVSQAGTATSYFLHVGLLKPGTRKVIQSIRLSDPSRGSILPLAELWEFYGPIWTAPPPRYQPLDTVSPRDSSVASMLVWTATCWPTCLMTNIAFSPACFRKSISPCRL